MQPNDWILLVTALGGIEGIKQLAKWWMSRKTSRRIDEARADTEEFRALREYNEFLQQQLTDKEQRFAQQTERLRAAQTDLFASREECARLRLEHAGALSELRLELALKRCERKKCSDREPQNGY